MSIQTLTRKRESDSKILNFSLWGVQIALAAMFFKVGALKLAGNEQMVWVFQTIGIGQWFRYVTGAIEVSSAVLLLTPFLSGLGALLLTVTMIGAVASHLLILGGNPTLPIVLLIGALFVLWGRKHQVLALVDRYTSKV